MAGYFERVSGAGKGRSRVEENRGKENIPSNEEKSGFGSRGGRKKHYEDAVKQLHTRIMGLRI